MFSPIMLEHHLKVLWKNVVRYIRIIYTMLLHGIFGTTYELFSAHTKDDCQEEQHLDPLENANGIQSTFCR